MGKFFSAIIFLLPVSVVLAHAGEEVEEHAGETVAAGPAIGSLILAGFLAVAVIGFLIWIVVKK
ncbi:MAG: hypothetical protein HYT98_00750 [Candidatus Sungbacteria bacterium]|nr:hypothetical protein [Candidatus Sungbacteria bacterium]